MPCLVMLLFVLTARPRIFHAFFTNSPFGFFLFLTSLKRFALRSSSPHVFALSPSSSSHSHYFPSFLHSPSALASALALALALSRLPLSSPFRRCAPTSSPLAFLSL